MSLSTETRNMIGIILSINWMKCTVSLGTNEIRNPGDGVFMIFSLSDQKKENYIYENFMSIKSMINIDVIVEKINIGAKMKVRSVQYESLRKELELLW